MRALPTRIHAILDYLYSALLIGLPWLLGFARGGAETWVPVAVGAGSLAYTLFTDHELGVVRRLQMTVHLWLDGLAGVFLAASPWVLGFDQAVRIPHLATGLALVLVAFMSDTIPSYERRRAGAR